MTLEQLGLLLLCALVAEVLGTMAGFGAATVLTPIASLFVDIKTAVALVAVFHLFGNASRLVFFHRHVNWRIVWQFGLIGVLGSLAGAQTAVWLPASAIRMALGVFLILFAVLEAGRLTSVRVPATARTLLLGGTASGFIAGLIGTGGAIRSVCLLAFGLPQAAYIGTSAVIALAVDATRLPVYLKQGFLPSSMVPVLIALTGIAFCGSWIGQAWVRRVSPARFKQLVLAMLFVMGWVLVLPRR